MVLVRLEDRVAVEGNFLAGLGVLGAELGVVECWFVW